MSQDPIELGHGSGEDGDPAAGTPPPSGGDTEVARLKKENAQLRADRRNDRVSALVTQHDLSATQALELAKLGDLNEIETKATEFVAAKAATPTPAPAPATSTDPAPTGEPASAGALAAMETGGEGAQPTPASLSWVEQMNQEVNQATSLEQVTEIQNRYRAQHAPEYPA